MNVAFKKSHDLMFERLSFGCMKKNGSISSTVVLIMGAQAEPAQGFVFKLILFSSTADLEKNRGFLHVN